LAAAQRHCLTAHHHLKLRHHTQQALLLLHLQIALRLVVLLLFGIGSRYSRI
jgi:hypothetical protein